MAYIDSSTPQDRAKSIAGVVAVHGALAYALVIGLQATGVIETEPNLQGTEYTEVEVDPIVPPPPPPENKAEEAVSSEAYTPPTRIDIVTEGPIIDTIDIPLPPVPEVSTNATLVGESTPVGPALPAFEVVAPRPRSDPSQWVTTADYRSAWINRELTGVARFRVGVGLSGRVESCAITGSSGHPELDRATCDLVTRRARFEPGRGADGERAPGSYSSAVAWQLPE